MRRYLYVVLLTVFFSFLWGVWWGFTPPEEGYTWLNKSESIKVLAPNGVLSKSFINDFAQQENINIELTEMGSAISMLRELLSYDKKYDVVLFSSFLSDSIILDHYFSELKEDQLDIQTQVSVDFLQLNFDPNNKYSVPLLWGVNGWLVPKKLDTPSFSLKSQDKLLVLDEPAELFGLSTKLMPIVRSWVETGETSKLMENKTFFSKFNFNSGIRQISSGALTDELLKDHVFRLAQERSHLWIMHASVSKSSSNKKLAEEWLRLVLLPKWSERLSNEAAAATVNKRLDSSDNLPAYRKASYIRRLPLNKIELFSSHEAYEPIFMSILQKIHPSVFN